MEYPIWKVYTERLTESGLKEAAAREIIDMVMTNTVNEQTLKQALTDALDRHESRYDEKLAAQFTRFQNKLLLAIFGLGGTILAGVAIAIFRGSFTV
ncbi:hypothetical protein [Pelagibius sp. Alg239-R121]|uniref:hypothetical protein n=1 Tax=Pelagibius sp. Alg239-R121 TaxID=2993448 RepID=UPI0024A75FD7|nr:hypothetical protein [Pelagibius sp. Alg239-R121]